MEVNGRTDDWDPSRVLGNDLTAPLNEGLESGAWTQSIIWSPRAPFRDFTKVVQNEEEVPEERPAGITCA